MLIQCSSVNSNATRTQLHGTSKYPASTFRFLPKPEGTALPRFGVEGKHFSVSRNETMPDFRHKLDAPKNVILDTEERTLVGSDFPARTLESGTLLSNSIGKQIIEMVTRTGLVILNNRSTPTFRRSGCEEPLPT